MKRNNSGFGHLGILLALAVVAAIALVGIYVHNKNTDLSGFSLSKASTSSKIQSADDAKGATQALDSLDKNASLDTDQLDQDIQNLL